MKANCKGSFLPFTPGTLSPDGEVAPCPVCKIGCYVTNDDVIEAHRPVVTWWQKVLRPRCMRCLHALSDHHARGCLKCLCCD